MRHRFEDLTSRDLAEMGPRLASSLAVLPVAATEQHGGHLPLGTDALIADGMIAELLALLEDDAPVTVLEPLRIGASAEHTAFPGTLDAGFEGTMRQILAIGRGLGGAGFRRIAIVSSHGGNTPAVEAAALELRRAHGLLVATASWMRFGVPDGLLPPAEVARGIHGGAVETSLMLHFRPDLVRLDRLADAPSLQAEMEERHRHLRAHGRLGFAWMAGDLHPSGTVGDARLASAEIGGAIARHQARGFAEFLADVLAFDLSVLSAGKGA